MVTTNRVYAWKDGDRLFVDVNGATIEAQSLTFDRQVVTLRFHARVVPLHAVHDQAETGHMGPREVIRKDPLAANEARVAPVPPHTRDPLLA